MNDSGLDSKILNNRNWFDCFELIKGYIISNWIGYDMKLNICIFLLENKDWYLQN